MGQLLDSTTDFFKGGDNEIFERLKAYAKKGGREATKMLLELYYVLKCGDTPKKDKVIIIAALAYQLLPKELLSVRRLGLLGLLDNGIALTIVYKRVKGRITPEISAQVEETMNRWFAKAN